MIHAKTATKLSDEIAMKVLQPILDDIDNKIKAKIKLKGSSRSITIELSNMVDEDMLLRIIRANGYRAVINYYPEEEFCGTQIRIMWE